MRLARSVGVLLAVAPGLGCFADGQPETASGEALEPPVGAQEVVLQFDLEGYRFTRTADDDGEHLAVDRLPDGNDLHFELSITKSGRRMRMPSGDWLDPKPGLLLATPWQRGDNSYRMVLQLEGVAWDDGGPSEFSVLQWSAVSDGSTDELLEERLFGSGTGKMEWLLGCAQAEWCPPPQWSPPEF